MSNVRTKIHTITSAHKICQAKILSTIAANIDAKQHKMVNIRYNILMAKQQGSKNF